jgi:hypothetical protein
VKMSVFCNVNIYRLFIGAYCIHYEGSKHLWIVGQFLKDCIAQHSRRQSSSAPVLLDTIDRVTLEPWITDIWQLKTKQEAL